MTFGHTGEDTSVALKRKVRITRLIHVWAVDITNLPLALGFLYLLACWRSWTGTAGTCWPSSPSEEY